MSAPSTRPSPPRIGTATGSTHWSLIVPSTGEPTVKRPVSSSSGSHAQDSALVPGVTGRAEQRISPLPRTAAVLTRKGM